MDKKTKSTAILVAVMASNAKHFPPWVNILIYMIIAPVSLFFAIREFRRNKKFVPIYILCSILAISATIAGGIESYWSEYMDYLGAFDKIANITGVLMLILIIYLGLTDEREEIKRYFRVFSMFLVVVAVILIFIIVILKYLV